MTLRIGWLSPFTRKTGIGTFSKAITDAMPAEHAGEALDVTIVAPLAEGMHRTRHRFVDIASASSDSRFYGLFDLIVCNIGNNTEHHRAIVGVLRHNPALVICHDHVYQHYLATLVHDSGRGFADYVALNARFGRPEALRAIRHSNVTRGNGLAYAPWDTEFSGSEPLGAPLMRLGSALVVHSLFAASYARGVFDGPVLRLGMPHDQRPEVRPSAPAPRPPGRAATLMSFGHVQPTKCIDDVLRAIAGSERLRQNIRYVVSGFSGRRDYLERLHGLVDELDLSGTVRFALDVSDAELARLGAQADAFINLRYPNTEGASVSLIEQLVTGKPVVVFDTGCYAELPDDAVVKVARPGDVGALRGALERLTADPAGLSEIGRRGRAHALRHDCRGYVDLLLDFVRRERALLTRRGAVTARRLIDVEEPPPDPGEDDEAWLGALAEARSCLDLLDRGLLARDTGFVRELSSEALVDYVQAAILRDGTNGRLNAALKAFFAAPADRAAAVGLMQLVGRLGIEADAEAAEALAELCPHQDAGFWAVIACLSPQAMGTIYFHLLLGTAPPADLWHGLGGPQDRLPPEIRLADAIAQADGRPGACPEEARDEALAALRKVPLFGEGGEIEPLPLGRPIVIGTAEQGRFVRLAGFFDAEGGHAWTRAHRGLVYCRPGKGAKRITLTGYSLDLSGSVSLSAERADSRRSSGPVPSRRETAEFEIELDEAPEAEHEPLRLSIHSSACRSPAELGLSSDGRRLGFCLQRVAVS